MSKQPWSPFYWRDYLGATSPLTILEHGAYLLLMAEYYVSRKPLDTNVTVLYRVCRAFEPTDRAAIDLVLARYFVLGPNGYTHDRIEEELAKSNDISDKRRKAVSMRQDRDSTIVTVLKGVCTPQIQIQSQIHKQDTEVRSTIKLDPPTALRGSRATRIPEYFIPNEEHYLLAKELGVNCEMEFQKFRDYYLGVSGSKGAKLDWPATLRNWLKNSINFGGGNGKQVSKAEQRTERNRAAILAGFGISPDVGPSRTDVPARTDARGVPRLAGNVQEIPPRTD